MIEWLFKEKNYLKFIEITNISVVFFVIVFHLLEFNAGVYGGIFLLVLFNLLAGLLINKVKEDASLTKEEQSISKILTERQKGDIGQLIETATRVGFYSAMVCVLGVFGLLFYYIFSDNSSGIAQSQFYSPLIIALTVYALAYYPIFRIMVLQKFPKVALKAFYFGLVILAIIITEVFGPNEVIELIVFGALIILSAIYILPIFSFASYLATLAVFYLEFEKSSELLAANKFMQLEVALLAVTAVFSYFLSLRHKQLEAERKKSKLLINQLTQDKGKIEAMLESMGDGVFVTDSQRKLILVNRAALSMAGVSLNSAANRFYGDVYPFKDKESVLLNLETEDPIQKAMTENHSVILDDLYLDKKGNEQIAVAFYASPVINAKGDIMGSIVLLRDVTKEKEIEKMKYEFVSIASHEISTPVAALEGNLSMVLDDKIGKIDADARKLLERAFDSSKRLSTLIKDLLVVSRIDEGKMSLNIEEADMKDMTEKIVNELSFKAKDAGVTLKVKMDSPKFSKVECDASKIREVITNLSGNAIKFTPKGTVTIHLAQIKDKLRVLVEDTGVGIDKEDIKHLFKKFHQIDSSHTRNVGGTGLGLYISRSIVELHGGKIWVESEVGKGSKFIFEIPLKFKRGMVKSSIFAGAER